jgi:hypothetical protein
MTMASLNSRKCDIQEPFSCCSLYFHIGAGYYSFPMWLNQILTNRVDMSRSELSLFGGTTYVSLGLCGTVLLWFSSFKLEELIEFKTLSAFGLVIMSLAWVILVWLVRTSDDVSDDVGLVGLAMVFIGLAAGTFYILWFGQVLKIVKLQWIFLYNNTTSMVFTAGATFYLTLKLFMKSRDWMLMVAIAQLAVLYTVVAWVFWKPELIFERKRPALHTNSDDSDEQLVDHTNDNAASSSNTSTLQMLLDLFFWRHKTGSNEQHDVSCRQFYLIVGCYTSVMAVSTSFMANLGPLTSNNDTTSDSSRAELLVMIYVAAGQTFGRFLVSVIMHAVNEYLEKRQISATAAMRMKNDTSLVLTLVIGVVIAAALICLKFVEHASFTVMSTVISVAYGMTWSVVSGYPSFFYKFDFKQVLSMFQIFGAAGTLSLVLLISVMQLGNTATFTVLLIGSLTTTLLSILALADRWASTPPKAM